MEEENYCLVAHDHHLYCLDYEGWSYSLPTPEMMSTYRWYPLMTSPEVMAKVQGELHTFLESDPSSAFVRTPQGFSLFLQNGERTFADFYLHRVQKPDGTISKQQCYERISSDNTFISITIPEWMHVHIALYSAQVTYLQ